MLPSNEEFIKRNRAVTVRDAALIVAALFFVATLLGNPLSAIGVALGLLVAAYAHLK